MKSDVVKSKTGLGVSSLSPILKLFYQGSNLYICVFYIWVCLNFNFRRNVRIFDSACRHDRRFALSRVVLVVVHVIQGNRKVKLVVNAGGAFGDRARSIFLTLSVCFCDFSKWDVGLGLLALPLSRENTDRVKFSSSHRCSFVWSVRNTEHWKNVVAQVCFWPCRG